MHNEPNDWFLLIGRVSVKDVAPGVGLLWKGHTYTQTYTHTDCRYNSTIVQKQFFGL